jgi:hypothetical protein
MSGTALHPGPHVGPLDPRTAPAFPVAAKAAMGDGQLRRMFAMPRM